MKENFRDYYIKENVATQAVRLSCHFCHSFRFSRLPLLVHGANKNRHFPYCFF